MTSKIRTGLKQGLRGLSHFRRHRRHELALAVGSSHGSSAPSRSTALPSLGIPRTTDEPDGSKVCRAMPVGTADMIGDLQKGSGVAPASQTKEKKEPEGKNAKGKNF